MAPMQSRTITAGERPAQPLRILRQVLGYMLRHNRLSFAIVIANILVPLIERATRPLAFGVKRRRVRHED